MPKISNLRELDISKAYTYALTQLKKTVLFNEFDIWKPYDNTPIEDYNLYVVKHMKNQQSVFLSKKYNLVYGLFLKVLMTQYEIEIKEYKKPSTILDVVKPAARPYVTTRLGPETISQTRGKTQLPGAS